MRYASVFAALFFTWDVSGLAQRVLEIDLTNQRVYLLDHGRVVLNSPISSGRPGHETPTGAFRVTDKDVNHASSFYGFFGNPVTKQIVVADADIDMKAELELELEGFERAKDELDIRHDAAKDQLKRQWEDD